MMVFVIKALKMGLKDMDTLVTSGPGACLLMFKGFRDDYLHNAHWQLDFFNSIT